MILTGQRLVVFGKPRRRGQRLCMEHPEFEVIENDDEISIHFRRITPIYPATEGLSQRVLRSLIYRLLEEYEDDDLVSVLPSNLTDRVIRRSVASRFTFPPRRKRSREHGRRWFWRSSSRCRCSSHRDGRVLDRAPGAAHRGKGKLLDAFLRALPFDLTNAQARVIEELRADLCSTFPMNRLLQGDVGSGKTVVAIAAMLLAVEAGFQAALMAPTQILAEQHYLVLRRWLEPLGVSDRPANSGPAGRKLSSRCSKEDAAAQIFVGTHALLYEPEGLERPGLVVIDEQHKFGVAQRARLTNYEPVPDVLVMTATPIPRTLTMSLYGDLDVSTIDEMPADRGRIVTAAREDSKITGCARFFVDENSSPAGRPTLSIH